MLLLSIFSLFTLFAAVQCAPTIEFHQLQAYLYGTSQIYTIGDHDVSGYLVFEGQELLSESLAIYDFRANIIALTHSVEETLEMLAKWKLYPRADQDYYAMLPLNKNWKSKDFVYVSPEYGNSEYLEKFRHGPRVILVDDISTRARERISGEKTQKME